MKRVGTYHLILNLVIVALYLVNVWLRVGAPPEATGPVWLSLASLVLLVVSGGLGGTMVYIYGVGVEPHRDAGTIWVAESGEAKKPADVRRPA